MRTRRNKGKEEEVVVRVEKDKKGGASRPEDEIN